MNALNGARYDVTRFFKHFLQLPNPFMMPAQVFILDALSSYTPLDEAAAKSAVERITARLSHANAAVVLSTIRLILRLLNSVEQDHRFVQVTHRKLGPPLGKSPLQKKLFPPYGVCVK